MHHCVTLLFHCHVRNVPVFHYKFYDTTFDCLLWGSISTYRDYKLGGSSALDATARRSRRYCHSRLTCAATQQTHPKAATPSDVTTCLSSPRVNQSVLYSQPCIYFQGYSLLPFRSQKVISGFYRCCVMLRCPTSTLPPMTLTPPPHFNIWLTKTKLLPKQRSLCIN